MNTIKSVYYGWGVLIGAGGLAYYLAKRSINADRKLKALDDVEWRKRQDQMRANEREYREYMLTKSQGILNSNRNGGRNGQHHDGDGHAGAEPSHEAQADPAPTRHAPTTQGQRTLEKSKYEASEVFKAPKGDRFTTSIWGSNK